MESKFNYQNKSNKRKKNQLIYFNPKILICIDCGNDKIESYEFGVSCEECGAFFGRSKC